MKQNLKLVLFFLSAMFIMTACDKDDDNFVPETIVRSAFNEMYPDAKRVEWENKLNYAVAEFNDNGKDVEVWFETGGIWLLTERDINVSDLPEAVKQSINAGKYAGWRIDEANYLERKDMEPVYVVDVEKGDNEVSLYYSVDGKLLKEVADGYYQQAVPTPVNPNITDIVSSQYPSAKIVEVDVEPNAIEVDLIEGNLYFTMILDKEYNWVQTEYDTEWTRVPDAVKVSFAEDGYTFNASEDEATMIIRADESIVYQIELDREPQDLILYYTSDGVRQE